MSSSTQVDAKEVIEEFVNGIKNLRKCLSKDVREMCILLINFVSLLKANENWKEQLTEHFSDIYWTLKLHLFFHLVGEDVVLNHEELKEFGNLLDLTNDELKTLPGIKHAVDLGSKVLEIISDVKESPEVPKGTKAHADAVMLMATDLFGKLSPQNRFRPKVVAKVSHNDKFVIGSSIAVSPFLRPLCLLQRILNFKRNLKKAITSYKPLCVAHEESMNWSSSAFQKENYTEPKAPCPNCQMVFKNLNGFISSEEKGGVSFLGACAEYCPVDELLLDDSEASSGADTELKKTLENNLERCSVLFSDFREIADKCSKALATCESGNTDALDHIAPQVIDTIHIFGFKPERKM